MDRTNSNLEALGQNSDSTTTRRIGRNIKSHLIQDLSESWGDSVLILSCFVTGLLDSAVFNVWSCFVSMQTGNTIYVGLGVSSQPKSSPYRWAKSLTSIIFFVFGAFFFSRTMRALGPMKRYTVVLSFVFQALLTFIPAALVQSGFVPQDAGDAIPDDWIVLLPLALLAWQSAGQIVMSRILGVGEITTVVLTSAYCDLFFDDKVLSAPLTENVKRNRRVASVVLLLLGAVAGGFLTRRGDIALALWVAGAIKVLIAAVWMGWRGKAEGIRLE
ncbi:hypothetical protein AAFC00_002164 [Neodothiora populina]|uniref:DUF1275 domain protein n=1 Tax=Neodothiora populina TaxID=2781224 RepID=A0ABR3PGG9_9PEZI